MNRLIAATLLGTALAFGAMGPVLAATAVTVNGVPISDLEIAQRVKLMQLEGGGSTKAATESLITEQLQLQEAKRLNINVTDDQVEGAFQQVARNVKLSTDKLNELLRARGVGADTMRSRLRAALAWQQVGDAAIKTRVDISDLELDQKAEAALTVDESYDYVLKEVLFITGPAGSAANRTAQANKYRSAFKGCDSAVEESLKYTDAAVRDVGRRHATQLPDAIAGELAKLNVGGISKPRVTETGVSMLAVCSKDVARDTTFIKSKLRNEEGTAAMKGEAEKYLADLRKKAQIVYQ